MAFFIINALSRKMVQNHKTMCYDQKTKVIHKKRESGGGASTYLQTISLQNLFLKEICLQL